MMRVSRGQGPVGSRGVTACYAQGQEAVEVSPEEERGARGTGALCFPAGSQAAWGCSTYLPRLPRQAAPSPSQCYTLNSSRGASLTAPHEIIIHYVTRREERECKCLDGISGNPRRDDLGAVIIHLIGAWGKLLDREM